MTIGTFILLAAIGSLVFLKLAIMVLLVVLLAKTMFAVTQKLQPHRVTANLFKLTQADR